jgi:peptide/nickel transport system permease protein
MIYENQIGLASNLWGVVAPAALIALLTIGTNTFTDAIARVSLGIERREELTLLSPDLGLVST